MQARRKCIGVDLGCNTIKVAELALEKGQLKITNLASAELSLPPRVSETERNERTLSVLRDLLRTSRIGTKEAVFCIPGQTVFVRRVKLPRTTEERLARIITYEARQQIPFPLDKTVMEYQVFSEAAGDEVVVLMVAVKREHINSFMEIVKKTGLKPLSIGVSSLALYNYYVYDSVPAGAETAEEPTAGKPAKAAKSALSLQGLFPSLFKKKPKPSEEPKEEPEEAEEKPEVSAYEEVKAYVNIGASMLDLSIARLGKTPTLGFTRSVPVAGNEITRCIQDRAGVESFEEAERIKKQQVVLRTVEAEEGAEQKSVHEEASEAAMFITDRLIAELRRSLDFYISQPEGMAIDALYLSGGQAQLPNLDNYIEEKLGLPVEVTEQTKNPAIALLGQDAKKLTPFLIAIGLGLQGLGLASITVDFLPGDLKTLREFKKKNVLIATIVILLLVTIGISTQVGGRYTDLYQREQAVLKGIVDQSSPDAARIEQIRQAREKLSDKFSNLGDALSDRDYWLKFLLDMQKQKPADVLIDRIIMDANGKVSIIGKTEDERSASDFTKNLQNALDNFESPPELYSITKVYDERFNKNVNEFEIKIDFSDKVSRVRPPEAAAAGSRARRAAGPPAAAATPPPVEVYR
jgi:Tfp pilus assembly PilM family ATPase/Tfp pilus assembly protein PilN